MKHPMRKAANQVWIQHSLYHFV